MSGKRKSWIKSLALIYILFSFSLFSCKRVEKKVLSDEDFLAPFGQGSFSLLDYIKNYSVQRVEYEKQFWFSSEDKKIVVHSPQKVSKITIRDIEYEIPEKWEGYVIRIDSPDFDFAIFYCDIDKMVCEGAEILKRGIEDEYFFVVTAGMSPFIFIFEVQQGVGSGGFCLFGSCGQYFIIPRFYICPENNAHIICQADEFSYKEPLEISQNSLTDYTISVQANNGTEVFQNELTIKVVKIGKNNFSLYNVLYDFGDGGFTQRKLSFYSEMIYDVELSISGKLYFCKSAQYYSPQIDVLGCDGKGNCWKGFAELQVGEGGIEEKEVKAHQAKFLIPSPSEITHLKIKKYHPETEGVPLSCPK